MVNIKRNMNLKITRSPNWPSVSRFRSWSPEVFTTLNSNAIPSCCSFYETDPIEILELICSGHSFEPSVGKLLSVQCNNHFFTSPKSWYVRWVNCFAWPAFQLIAWQKRQCWKGLSICSSPLVTFLTDIFPLTGFLWFGAAFSAFLLISSPLRSSGLANFCMLRGIFTVITFRPLTDWCPLIFDRGRPAFVRLLAWWS